MLKTYSAPINNLFPTIGIAHLDKPVMSGLKFPLGPACLE